MIPPATAVFSTLLVFTGVAKLVRPNDTARAIGAAGIPRARPLTFLVAITELLVGLGTMVTVSSILLVIQAVLYLLFFTWVAVALNLNLPIASCGCVGRPDTPPYSGHLILNSAGVAFSLSGALTGALEIRGFTEGLAYAAIVVVGTWLAWAILNDGARAVGLVPAR